MSFKLGIPPIKSQGIKTKLIPWIKSIIPADFNGAWIEPFMGTGVVAFNLASERALLADTNPHLVNFYAAISRGEITPALVTAYLIKEGALLLEKGEEHYYLVRNRFNAEHSPLDFLFLNRAAFNGMIRFNRKGGFNTPFCRKPNRFSQAYITKITNQVTWVAKLIQTKNVSFQYQDFAESIAQATQDDIIYCDPPYIDRHVDYYNSWNNADEQRLFEALADYQGRFILSTWHHNKYRENEYIKSLWWRFSIATKEHFYHIGGREKNRNTIVEALVTNFAVLPEETTMKRPTQFALLM